MAATSVEYAKERQSVYTSSKRLRVLFGALCEGEAHGDGVERIIHRPCAFSRNRCLDLNS
eukprot:scaffold5092_cov179-Amphora_coffeaeformis.AAC.15